MDTRKEVSDDNAFYLQVRFFIFFFGVICNYLPSIKFISRI
jgi:hypothetical protein